ncbi:MAG: hypothetical protein ABH951_00265 [Patescibacteria group bacterium]
MSKKIIISILITLAVATALYFLVFNSASKTQKPLTATVPTILWEDTHYVSVVFEIKNPNRNWASDNFTYKINFYDDKDNVVISNQESFFIYANETETIVKTRIDSKQNMLARAEIAIGDTNWILAKDFKEPNIKIVNTEVAKQDKSYEVRFKISNPNSFDISEVHANAVLYSKEGKPIALANTSIVPPASKPFESKKTRGLFVFAKVNPATEQYIDISAISSIFTQRNRKPLDQKTYIILSPNLTGAYLHDTISFE